MFFAAASALSSSAYSVVCSQGPTSQITGNGSNQLIYSCTIPANKIATDRSIRITANVVTTGGAPGVNGTVLLNGVTLVTVGVDSPDMYWQFTIMNTGATTGYFAGIFPYYNSSEPFVNITPAADSLSGLSWASAQTLEIEFDASSAYTATGTTFIVEAID